MYLKGKAIHLDFEMSLGVFKLTKNLFRISALAAKKDPN